MYYPDYEPYLADFENQAFNAGYDVDYTTDPSRLIVTPREDVAFMPTIVGEYHTNDTNFWFSPTMNFPTPISEDTIDKAHFTYYLEKWYRAAKLADYLMEHSFALDVEWGD